MAISIPQSTHHQRSKQPLLLPSTFRRHRRAASGQTDGRTDGWTDGRTNGKADGFKAQIVATALLPRSGGTQYRKTKVTKTVSVLSRSPLKEGKYPPRQIVQEE
eukprot:TRINITY_DN1166_c0_g2_i1.p2 TRINITY_DN1166_c0_g2~~TRINITY_DN1166_c0_g2_i1.p2  ORF type:complete len:104 (-),score=3.32 TRINITY_DN1166_c0_g2_i1:448-759(-)